MTNSEFKKLENIDKINYINSELKKGKSIKAITIDLGLGKNYINQFMKRSNYKRIVM